MIPLLSGVEIRINWFLDAAVYLEDGRNILAGPRAVLPWDEAQNVRPFDLVAFGLEEALFFGRALHGDPGPKGPPMDLGLPEVVTLEWEVARG